MGSVTAQLQDLLSNPPSAQMLEIALRLLAKWRSQVILQTILVRDGTRVQTGPFAGMIYPNAASEGAGAVRLLGGYEAAIFPVIDQIIASDYAQIIDVGCAEGYYAVGLARAVPAAQVIARDANPAVLALCAKLASDNGVADRVTLGGVMSHHDFDICTHARTVVICDIEGGEGDLLNPARAPGLLNADILVETHDCLTAGLSDLITARFAATHHIRRFDRVLNPGNLPAWMHGLSDLDRLLALWEWRAGPTPWLWMERKS